MLRLCLSECGRCLETVCDQLPMKDGMVAIPETLELRASSKQLESYGGK